MSDTIKVGQLYPASVPPAARRTASSSNVTHGRSFEDILQDKTLHFSHHAEVRMKQRGIELRPDQLEKMHTAIEQAASKGSKDSLIVMNSMAFIVNIPNRTVVTAMDGNGLQNNVFTQIDSAVILN